MKAVLDTDVLISAFTFPGGAAEAAYRSALEGRVELVTSVAVLAELARVLVESFGWRADLAEDAVQQIARIGVVDEPAER